MVIGNPSLLHGFTWYSLPTPSPLASGGESDISACGPPASFSVHLAVASPRRILSTKSRGDNVVRMWSYNIHNDTI